MLAIADNAQEFLFLRKRLGAGMNLQHPFLYPT
jgi:hypothetical protein